MAGVDEGAGERKIPGGPGEVPGGSAVVRTWRGDLSATELESLGWPERHGERCESEWLEEHRTHDEDGDDEVVVVVVDDEFDAQ
eukprot:753813-Hanusia_phi.AAC.1